MITDGEERDSGRAGSDKANESVSVVDGGCIKQISHRLSKSSNSQENHFSWDAAQVIRY